MKKILRITTLLLSASFIIAMSVFYQSCDPIRYCHLLKGVTVIPANTATFDTLNNMDSVRASHFNLEISLQQEQFSCKNERFSFINSAYATKLAVLDVFYDTIKSITITSNQNYDSIHPAGASLNDLFNIPQQFENKYGFIDFLSYSLSKAPDTEDYHQFRVSVEISGTIPYDTILPPIKILF